MITYAAKSSSAAVDPEDDLHGEVQPTGGGVQGDAGVARAQQQGVVGGVQPQGAEGNVPQVQVAHALLVHGLLGALPRHQDEQPGQAAGGAPLSYLQASVRLIQ